MRSVRPVVLASTLALAAASMVTMRTTLALATARTFHATGRVVSFSADRRTVYIAHDDIPGFMQAMTMPFQVPAAALIEGLSVHDRVQFVFRADDDDRQVLVSIERAPAR